MTLPSLRTLTPAEVAAGPATDLAACLERGAIVQFPPDALPLPPPADLEFLRTRLGKLIALKNISYHPEGGYVSGLKRDPAACERTRWILREHNTAVTLFLRRLLPEYADEWSCGKVNYRPLEEQGREISRHSSNELVHVDAFASGATHGDRTLSGLVRGVSRLGLPQAATVDTSPYDRAMHRLHNTLKDDDEFQRDEKRWSYYEFPPFSSWIVFTDLVSHACVRGQHALVNTWTVRRSSLRLPELSPYEVLARARG